MSSSSNIDEGKLAVKLYDFTYAPMWNYAGDMFIRKMRDDEVLFILGDKTFPHGNGNINTYIVIIQDGVIGIVEKGRVRYL